MGFNLQRVRCSHTLMIGFDDCFCQTEEEDNIKVAVPALLRGGSDPSNPGSPTDSLLQLWDSKVTTLVRSSINPQCSILGGDLYILTGAGGLGAAEDGNNQCQMKLLWSAVCCAVPEGKSGFSVGLIREAEGGERQVNVKELEEMLGVAELFTEGCGGADGETVGITLGLTGNTEKEEDVGSDTTNNSNEVIKENRETLIGGERVAGVDAQPDVADVADITQESSTDATTSEGSGEWQHDVTRSGAVRSETPESSSEDGTVDEQETDTNSSSSLVFVLSTTLSILKAPLRPVFSTITQLPGQVIQVTEPFRHSLKVHSDN